MKQSTFFIIFCLFCVMSGHAQNLDSIEQEVLSMPPGEEKLAAYNELAWLYKIKDPDAAQYYVEEALKIALDYKSQKGLANAYHNKGMIYWYQDEYDKASQFFLEALQIREEIRDTLGLSRSYNNIGNLFFRQENYDNAANFYQKALDYRQILGDSTGLLYSYSSLADIYNQRDEIEKARAYYKKGAQIAEAIKHSSGLAFVYNNYGLSFLKTQELDSAQYYFTNALNAAKDAEDATRISETLNQLASLNLALKKFDRAEEYAAESKNIAVTLRSKKLLAEASKVLSLSLAGQDDYKGAFGEMERYNEISSKLTNTEREKYILEIQSKYEAAQKQTEFLEQKSKTEQLRRNFLILLIAVGILATLTVLYMYREQVRTARLLASQKSRIQEQNKELKRSNASLEQFAYVASHDLKEPLRNINTFTSLLQRSLSRKGVEQTADTIEYMSIINAGVNHMGGLLDDILDYSKLSKNKDVKVEQVDMNEVIDSIRMTLKQTIEEKNVVISSDRLPIINTNRFQMYQLFQNFISNGIKFNDSEQKVIHVGYQQGEENLHQFSVSDNGIGISQEYEHKIFQIFQRLDKNKYEGTGIGLAICKKIIDQHDGTVKVESVEPHGTLFKFSLKSKTTT